MKLSLALASAFGLLVSQGQSARLRGDFLATVVVEGDGCANLDCGTACYDLSNSAKTELTKISQGKRGDTTKVSPGEFWTIGVCNPGGQCVPDVQAAAASCDDPVNDATLSLAVIYSTYGGVMTVSSGGFGDTNPDTDALVMRNIIPVLVSALAKRAVKAFAAKLAELGFTSEEIVEAAIEALQSLKITTVNSLYVNIQAVLS